MGRWGFPSLSTSSQVVLPFIKTHSLTPGLGTTTTTQRFIGVQIAEFRESFRLFDKEGEGEVTKEQYMDVMKLFGEAEPRYFFY